MKTPSELGPLFLKGLPYFAERHEGLTYQHLNLGQPGWWGGLCLSDLGLKDPVDFKAVDRVFTSGSRETPASPAEARNPVVATLLNFEADPQISGLWALGSQDLRRSILTLHQRSVDRTMADLQTLAGAASFVAKGSVPHGFVYAAFTRCANDALQPCLRTSVLVSCRFALPEGQTVENPLSLRHGGASGRFKRWEGSLFENAIGPLGVHSETSLPPGLFRAATSGEQIRWCMALSKAPKSVSQGIQRQWRIDAAEQGYGYKRVQAVLYALRKHRTKRNELAQSTDPRREDFWKGILIPENRPKHPGSHDRGMEAL